VEVAKFVKVSQTKISRLLALARNAASCAFRSPNTSRAIKTGSNAAKAIRAQGRRGHQKRFSGANGEDARLTVAHFGATFVTSLVAPGSTVAISGGRTLRENWCNFSRKTRSCA